ncbi:hypothetical protein LguiB_029758 [Lonicera macranthoides]
MELSSDIVETSTNSRSRFKKTKGPKDVQEDRLSNLPDSILIHILSFLPVKDAVNTVLLRRFGSLWCSLRTLDFDGRSYDNLSDDRYNKWFFDFVHHVLLLHESPTIFKFSLKFGSYLYFLPNDIRPNRRKKHLKSKFADKVGSWIKFAVKKKVKVLDLGILAHGSSTTRFDYDLPNNVLTCDSLTELKLVSIGLNEKSQVHMRLLKTLSLTTIVLSDAMIEQILSGCPLLERLSIIQCCGIRKLNCTSTYLKNLMLVLGECSLVTVEISGPHLSTLHISGFGHVDLKNLSSLVEATIDLCFGGACPVDGYFNVGMVLEKLHHANTFTICNWCILVLTLWELTGVPCPTSPRKFMTLKTPLTKWHLPGISSLLRASPNLEMLSIHIEAEASVIYTGDDLRLGISGIREGNYWDNKIWLISHDFDEKIYWNSKLPFSCLLNHLKTVKISGFVSNLYLLPLAKFLLGHSCMLEKMVIYTGQSIRQAHQLSSDLLEFPNELSELSQKLSHFPRASDRVVILFS